MRITSSSAHSHRESLLRGTCIDHGPDEARQAGVAQLLRRKVAPVQEHRGRDHTLQALHTLNHRASTPSEHVASLTELRHDVCSCSPSRYSTGYVHRMADIQVWRGMMISGQGRACRARSAALARSPSSALSTPLAGLPQRACPDEPALHALSCAADCNLPCPFSDPAAASGSLRRRQPLSLMLPQAEVQTPSCNPEPCLRGCRLHFHLEESRHRWTG